MNIGIIGTGNIGGTLAKKLAGAGHEVAVANSRGTEAVRPFALEIGARPADIAEVVDGVDLIIVSVPLPAITKLKGLFQDVPMSVPVIDTGNYYPGLRDARVPEIDSGKTESVWVSEQIGRSVIKAFNDLPSHSLTNLGQPAGSQERIAVAVAGDNPEHKLMVSKLIETDIGFDVVDGGTLEESWRQQPCTRAYCCDWGRNAMSLMLKSQKKGEAQEKYPLFRKKLVALGSEPNHSDVIALNRSLYPQLGQT